MKNSTVETLIGTAVVAIAEGGVRESIVEGVNGRLIAGDDSVRMGAAISDSVHDLARAFTDGVRAREHVLRRWDWETSVDRTITVSPAIWAVAG